MIEITLALIVLAWMFLPTLLSFRAVNTINRWNEMQYERDNQLSEVLTSIALELKQSAQNRDAKALAKSIDNQTAVILEVATAIRERPIAAPTPEPKKPQMAESTKDKVRKYKADNPNATQGQIAKALGLTQSAVSKALKV